jgi:hypothetical protein
MLGVENDDGIIPRVCAALMRTTDEGISMSFSITYVEIFLERVRDLLRPTTSASSTQSNLKVREHPTDGPFVEGATVEVVRSFEECMSFMKLGSKNRAVASTKMNSESSRSHAIFTLQFSQSKKLESQVDDKDSGSRGTSDSDTYSVISKINLVDLAGSENANTAGSEGDRLKEGASINKSLLTLGRVIKTLADNAARERSSGARYSLPGPVTASDSNDAKNMIDTVGKGRRGSLMGPSRRPSFAPSPSASGGSQRALMAPYRDSVLTYLLKESLGGNAKTTMVATIRPGEFNNQYIVFIVYSI